MNSLFYLNKLRLVFISLLVLTLCGCVTHPPPRDLNNVCNIFKQYPKWYTSAQDVERRWRVPVHVQMAIMHQESKFVANARPPRKRLFFSIIPWKRPTTAYGYAQVLDGTWREYRMTNGGFLSSRRTFGDGADFIGWYANLANRRAGIQRSDAYSLYLAYHEGIGGYQRKSYLRKGWLMPVARKVKVRSDLYARQLKSCQSSLGPKFWFGF